MTVYFSEVDTAGHDYGPDSPEVATAVAHLDAALGDLVSGVDRLGLTGQTTFVVVSDHGMTPLSAEKVIYVDDYLNTAAVDVTDWSPVLGVWPRTVSVDRAYALLKGKHPALDVYRRKDIPRALHYNDNPRIPPVVGIAKEGWTITSHARQQARLKTGRRAELGGHGYDPAVRSMHALLVAAGPLLRTGLVVPEFRSVDVYDLLCAIANLKPAPNDGDAGLAKSLLK